MPTLEHRFHRHLRLRISDRSQTGDEVVDALTVIREDADSVQRELAGITNENGVRIILLNLRIKRWLRLGGTDGVVVAGEDYDVHPIG